MRKTLFLMSMASLQEGCALVLLNRHTPNRSAGQSMTGKIRLQLFRVLVVALCAWHSQCATRLTFKGEWPGYTRSTTPSGVALSGSRALVCYGRDGIDIVDCNVPTSLKRVTTFDTPGEATRVALSGSHAFVADGTAGLQVIDVSVPSSPVGTASCALNGSAVAIQMSSNLACVLCNPTALAILDVSSPAHPIVLGTYTHSNGNARDLAISGHYVFIANGNKEFFAVDAANPANPVLAGTCTPTS
ncbi:MAG: hypothetical protein QHJ82_11130 [Verrucomicrobiota bacterium]|nr:hypothetical protein [Verrucomicrobiota bacterium]